MHFDFIGAGGSSTIGPYLSPFGDLASLYTAGATVLLHNGTDPSTAKSVQIDFLPTDQKIRVSACYPDTRYDTGKACVFTLDSQNSVDHEAWRGRPATVFYTSSNLVRRERFRDRSPRRACVFPPRPVLPGHARH